MADLGTGVVVGLLAAVVAGVVLVLAAGLDTHGMLHFAYLLVVVGVPSACLLIAVPNLLDAEFGTPIRAVALLVVGSMLALTGAWSSFVDPTRLRVDRHGLGATGVTRPIVVGVVADLHLRAVGDYERNAVDAVLEADPDIVVLPGDLYHLGDDELAGRLPEYVGLLRRLTERVDTVVLTAGHTDSGEVLGDLAESAGAVYLADQILDTVVGGQPVSIVGLVHPFDGDVDAIDPSLTTRLRNEYDGEDLVLMVSHRPDPVLSLPDGSAVDLLISGHTHGGQVSLPGIGPLVSRSGLPRLVVAGGLHLVNGHAVYVSTGVGVERGQAPPIRFRTRPSVGVLTIVPS